ncbi:MAG: DUF3187 family protein [Halioglobus sp.]|nr:DUF3187 family protein [Halioglobus sp.]
MAAPVAPAEPLHARNLSPFAALPGVPAQREAQTAAPGRSQFALYMTLANHFNSEATSREFLYLDGETVRTSLAWRLGVAAGWDVQLEVPWVRHSGGHLDRLVDEWHDLWNLSGSGRDGVPRDQLVYRYLTRSGGFELFRNRDGLGDISFSVNRALWQSSAAAVTASVGYKLATGSERKLTGSGEEDVFAALRLSGTPNADLPLRWHAQAGYLRAGAGGVLGPYRERDLWFAGLSVDWRLAASMSLLAQVDAHAAPLRSELETAGREAVQVMLGGRWQLAPHWQLDLGLAEDVQVDSFPDVTLHLALRYVPGRG